MTDAVSGQYDLGQVLNRIEIINNTGNESILEIQQRGSLRVPIEKAFRNPDYLVKLITQICILKEYASSAAAQFGSPMGLAEWNAWFEEFKKSIHVAPGGGLPQ